MIILGLTGSIGMGKSTTAQMFRDEGCLVFDADQAVHDLYAKGGEAVPLIRAVFPDAIKDDAVDRAILGKHMREDPLNLTVLESFIHPMVAKTRDQFFKDAFEQNAELVVMDIPLLFESKLEGLMTKIAVVTAPFDIQKQRVLARPGMSEEMFNMILSRQVPDAEKRKKADYLIFSDKGLDNAREQVQTIIKELTGD